MSRDSDIRSSGSQDLRSSSSSGGNRKVSARRKRSGKANSAQQSQGGAHVRQGSSGTASGYGAKAAGGKEKAGSTTKGRSSAANHSGADAAGSHGSSSVASQSTTGHGSGSSKTGSEAANHSATGSASKTSKSSAKAAKSGSGSSSKRAFSGHGSDRNSRTVERANAKSGSASRNSRSSKGSSSTTSGERAYRNPKGYARSAGSTAGTASGTRSGKTRSGMGHGNAKGSGTLSAGRSTGTGSKGVSSSKGTKTSGSRNTASGRKAAGSVAGVNANGTGTSAASTEMARKAARSQRKASGTGSGRAAKASKGSRGGTNGVGTSGARSQRNSRSSSKNRGNGFVWAGRVLAVVVLAFALFYVVDGIANFGKVHSNVTVGDVEVGGLTQAEAAEAIDAEYSSVGEDATITLYASEEAMSSDEEPTEITFDYDTIDEFTSDPPDAQVFSVTTSDLEAYVDSESLAEQAYSVGRGKDFFLGRLGAVLFGKSIDLEVTTDDIYTEALEEMLTSALGVAMTNPGIAYDEEEGSLVTTIGNDGYMVEEEQFLELLGEAIISGDNSLVVPMADVYMEIDDEAAEDALLIAQQATQEPVTLELDGLSWELDSVTLGELTTTFIDGKDLVPYIGYENLQEYVPTLEGLSDECTEASDVLFEYNGTTLSYTEASTGVGPDYKGLAERLNSIVYGSEDLVYESGEIDDEADAEDEGTSGESSDGSSSGESDETDAASDDSSSKGEEDYTESDAARVATIVLEVTEPDMTYDDAVSLGLNAELICEYSTSYASASSGKSHNIELLSSILTNTVVAPGETFSLNDTAGECNEEKGFEEANAIVNGEYSSEIGGGICQVATTVFDAVFNAGYPIVERHNHSTYVSSYEDGLDAAIAYPYLDFKFKNDTDNYLMILLDCDGSTVTCSLWGVSPGYTTEYEMVSWEEGEEYEEITREDSEELEGTEYIKSYGSNGHIVVIERDTYDSNGELIREDTFTSEYAAVDEVTIIGTGTSDSTSDGTT